jgi:polyhydroxyalkanoate synthesis regulator phasin
MAKDEDQIVGIVQMLYSLGEDTFSAEEVKDFIDHQVKEGALSLPRADELKDTVEEREERHQSEKEERIEGIIEMLVNLEGEAISLDDVKDFTSYLVERGSLSKEKAEEIMNELGGAEAKDKLESLREELKTASAGSEN